MAWCTLLEDYRDALVVFGRFALPSFVLECLGKLSLEESAMCVRGVAAVRGAGL